MRIAYYISLGAAALGLIGCLIGIAAELRGKGK